MILYKKLEDKHCNIVNTPWESVAEQLKSEGYIEAASMSKFTAVIEGFYYLNEDAESDEALAFKKQYENSKEIIELKIYLAQTDYVIAKLNELKLEDDEEYETEKANYSEILAKRKSARARIRELEE